MLGQLLALNQEEVILDTDHCNFGFRGNETTVSGFGYVQFASYKY